ncbi:MAG TPA: lipoyl(octanoyl) transferase LipB [Anaerovoracaceae bacterium]|nr:lipoyl(octanoyl) transferase LipB [Anaerovoracaceae bacterium]
MKLNVVSLGRVDYMEALALQEKLLVKRQQGEIDNTLLLLEHPPVLTLGKRGVYSNIIVPRVELDANRISIYEVARGGDVTYHGPGQIVGYPIIDLKDLSKGVKDFVWTIEEVFIRLLKNEYGITAHREEKKYTGVWVGDEKITAIGIAVKHWVTMHGFAFNVNTDLEHYKWINPCGISDKGVTSLEKLLGHPQDFDKLIEITMKYFCEIFDFEPVTMDGRDLWEMANRIG